MNKRWWGIFWGAAVLVSVAVAANYHEAGLPPPEPEPPAVEAGAPAQEDEPSAWDFDLAAESDAVLRRLVESGADDDSFSALQALAARAGALAESAPRRADAAVSGPLAAYLAGAADYYRLLVSVREGSVSYPAARSRAEELLDALQAPPDVPPEYERYLPALERDLEHDARYPLLACHLNQLRRTERALGVASLTFAGDTTFGEYPEVPPGLSFSHELAARGGDLAFPLRNVAPFFQNDSLSVLNCEGTFTDAEQMARKRYRFKGPAEYVQMFVNGGVEAVNLANNHTRDYLEQGFADTLANLDRRGVLHYGEQDYLVCEADGIRFGFFGYDLFNQMPEDEEMERRLRRDIAAVREQGAEVVVATFHWGLEYHNEANWFQQKTARLAVDLGADVVAGHHPHVLQGIEVYRGRPILYSLGNFAFGGDEELKDGGDTMLVRLTFQRGADGSVEQGAPLVVPANVSTAPDRNNYMPRPLFGEEADRVAGRLAGFSAGLAHGAPELDYLG